MEEKMGIYEEIVSNTPIGYLASIDGAQPRVRPMSFVHVPGGKLWSSTYNISGKMDEFLQNDRVEVCFVDSGYRQLRVEGRIDTTGDSEKKKQLLALNPGVRNHFPNEDDEHFVHLEITPTRVRWKNTGFSEYEEIAIEP